MSKKANTGICGECQHYDAEAKQCQLIAQGIFDFQLTNLKPDTRCMVQRFEPASEELEFQQPEEKIGLRKFGDLIGVSLAAVQKAIDTGRIPSECVEQTSNGRKLKLKKALDAWQQVHDTSKDQPRIEADVPVQAEPEDGINWVRRKTKAEALLAEERGALLQLERLEKEGQLHNAEDVEAVWSVMLSRFRARVLAIPATAAPVIASMPDRSAAKVKDLLEAQVFEALSELSVYDKAAIESQRKKRTGK